MEHASINVQVDGVPADLHNQNHDPIDRLVIADQLELRNVYLKNGRMIGTLVGHGDMAEAVWQVKTGRTPLLVRYEGPAGNNEGRFRFEMIYTPVSKWSPSKWGWMLREG